MTDETPPDWAIERACAFATEAKRNPKARDYTPEWIGTSWYGEPVLRAFARYIAQHEQPPVDPDLLLAREIAGMVAAVLGRAGMAENYRAGRCDDDFEMVDIVKLLKERKA